MRFNIPLMFYDACANRAKKYREFDELIIRLNALSDRIENDLEEGELTVLEKQDQEDISKAIDFSITW